METTVAEIFCERSEKKTRAHHWRSALFNPGLLRDFLLVFGNLHFTFSRANANDIVAIKFPLYGSITYKACYLKDMTLRIKKNWKRKLAADN